MRRLFIKQKNIGFYFFHLWARAKFVVPLHCFSAEKHRNAHGKTYARTILNIKIFIIMSTTNKSAKANAQNANTVVINAKATANVFSYVERMRDHKRIYTSPSKCIKNAFATAQTDDGTPLQKLYAKAVASVFDPKNAEHTKSALQALLKRYEKHENAPRKGYSEYYVHQYFEKLIDQQRTTNAACYNYRALQRVAEQNAKQ